jgi:uncharacterized membrane protein
MKNDEMPKANFQANQKDKNAENYKRIVVPLFGFRLLCF